MDKKTFVRIIWTYYRKHGRHELPWRKTENPYHILVSEIMLQQTQVSRVLKKYPEFIKKFPNFTSLTKAPLSEVLKIWQGMGYNRRAIALQNSSKIIVETYGGILPQDPEVLKTLPGIGPATAASIAAFAFNVPVICIETNIRRTYIHHFFQDKKGIRDEAIEELVKETLPAGKAREWYWALMDYGSMLGISTENANLRSKKYRKQPAFKGSLREVRGYIIRELSIRSKISLTTIKKEQKEFGDRAEKALASLKRDGFIVEIKKNIYTIKAEI